VKLGIVFAALVIGLVAFGQPAVAAKPTPSGTVAIAAGSDLNLGGLVTFDVTVQNIGNENPRIQLVCSQAGVQVYAEAHNVFDLLAPSPWDGPAFKLGGGSSYWTEGGGSADCVATLYYWDAHPVQTFVPLAEVSFAAGG
jgi:hypothetical protein